MKKILALVLALVMVLSLAACGGTKTETPKTEAPKTEAPKTEAPKSDKPAVEVTPPPVEVSQEVEVETVHGPFGDYLKYTTPHTEELGPVEPGVLWVGQEQNVEAGNPFANGATPFIDLVYDKLLEYDLDTGELKGVVFKDWEMAPDNSYMTFTMHDNIIFHDGTHATAEDVFYTLERAIDPSISQQADKNVFGNIDFDKSEITDTYSGKIVLKVPTVTFTPGLTKAWLLCKDYITKVGEDNAWWSNCVGSGPYKCDEIVAGDRYVVSKFDQYWKDGEKNAFDKIIIRSYSEQATMYMDYETHNLDMIIGPSSSDMERVANGDINNSVLAIYSLLNTYSIVVNEEMGNPALKDENVRKALALAIDPETVEAFSWEFLGAPATSVVPSGLPDSVPMAYEQNIEEAKAALAAAGYKPGELTIKIGTHSGAQVLHASESVQSMLEEVGFKTEMIIADRTAHILNMRNAGPDTYDVGITMQAFETLESANLLGTISHANGSVSFTAASDDKVDDLVMQAKAATSVEAKQELMKELQNYLSDHYWIIPLVEATYALVYRDYVDGIRVLIPRMCDFRMTEFK